MYTPDPYAGHHWRKVYDSASAAGRAAAGRWHTSSGTNLSFYCNNHPVSFGGRYRTIDDIHKWGFGDYAELEDNHSWIQWLFPSYFQSSFNSDARPLTREEAGACRQDREVARRVVKSYKLWLDFLGMYLVDERTGQVGRNTNGNFNNRYRDAFLHFPHNHLRIRRVLASLSVLGFRRYVRPFVAHLENEIEWHKSPYRQYLRPSCIAGTSGSYGGLSSSSLRQWREAADDAHGVFQATRASPDELNDTSIFLRDLDAQNNSHYQPSTQAQPRPLFDRRASSRPTAHHPGLHDEMHEGARKRGGESMQTGPIQPTSREGGQTKRSKVDMADDWPPRLWPPTHLHLRPATRQNAADKKEQQDQKEQQDLIGLTSDAKWEGNGAADDRTDGKDVVVRVGEQQERHLSSRNSSASATALPKRLVVISGDDSVFRGNQFNIIASEIKDVLVRNPELSIVLVIGFSDIQRHTRPRASILQAMAQEITRIFLNAVCIASDEDEESESGVPGDLTDGSVIPAIKKYFGDICVIPGGGPADEDGIFEIAYPTNDLMADGHVTKEGLQRVLECAKSQRRLVSVLPVGKPMRGQPYPSAPWSAMECPHKAGAILAGALGGELLVTRQQGSIENDRRERVTQLDLEDIREDGARHRLRGQFSSKTESDFVAMLGLHMRPSSSGMGGGCPRIKRVTVLRSLKNPIATAFNFPDRAGTVIESRLSRLARGLL